MSKPINVAMIGLGFGAEFIPIYQALPDANVYAICQRNTEKLNKVGNQFGIEKRIPDHAAVPKEAADRMEGVLARVHKTPMWKEHAERSLYESLWMGSAEYGKHPAERRAQHVEFLQSVGLMQKP